MAKVKRARWDVIKAAQEAKIKRPIKNDCTQHISDLPKRTVKEILQMQQNAFVVLDSVEKRKMHNEARRLLKAINKEFIRRYRGKPQGDGYFHWPNTDTGLEGEGFLSETGWVTDGVLSYYGYRVGITDGKSASLRRIILDEVFSGVIPPVFATHYLYQWGAPNSASRLRKMAEALASFSKNAKRRDALKLACAIKDWEEDLEFLYFKYYVDRFHFGWPKTSLS